MVQEPRVFQPRGHKLNWMLRTVHAIPAVLLITLYQVALSEIYRSCALPLNSTSPLLRFQ